MSFAPNLLFKTILLCIAWYLTLALVSQVNKYILGIFTYPMFLSQANFLAGTCLSYVMVKIATSNAEIHKHFAPGTLPSVDLLPFRKVYLYRVLPLGVLKFISLYSSLNATLLVPVATVASIKALSPLLMVAGYRLAYNVKFPLLTYLLLAPLLAGVIMMILVDARNKGQDEDNHLFLPHLVRDHTKGLALSVVGTVTMVTGQIYGKELFTWRSPANNPALLVLNTDPSRPVTPVLPSLPTSPGASSLPMHSEKKSRSSLLPYRYFNQRPAAMLPYLVSDLQLDELAQAKLPPPRDLDNSGQSYLHEVRENQILGNPLAALAPAPGDNAKSDKLTTIFYVSLVGFAFSFLAFMLYEAPLLISALRHRSEFQGLVANNTEAAQVAGLVLLNSVLHFGLTVLSFSLLGLIPALSYSIASMLKRIVVILVSVLFAVEGSGVSASNGWFRRMSIYQVQGLVSIAVGLYCYDRWGSKSLKANRGRSNMR